MSERRKRIKPSRAERALLDPFGHDWMAMVGSYGVRVGQLDDDELAQVRRGLDKVDAGNIWWAIYDARPAIHEAVVREQYRRQREREATPADKEPGSPGTEGA